MKKKDINAEELTKVLRDITKKMVEAQETKNWMQQRAEELGNKGYFFQEKLSTMVEALVMVKPDGDCYLLYPSGKETHNPPEIRIKIKGDTLEVGVQKGFLTDQYNKVMEYREEVAKQVSPEELKALDRTQTRGEALINLGYDIDTEQMEENGHAIFRHPFTGHTIALGLAGCEHDLGITDTDTKVILMEGEEKHTYYGKGGEA